MHGLCVEGHTLTDAQRLLVESALVYSGGTHTVDDVEAMLADKSAQLWEGPHSLIVTTVDTYPREKVLHVFLAAGVQAELLAMQDTLRKWAVSVGCTKARVIGRKGWVRALAHDPRWTEMEHIVLEQDLHGHVGIGGRESQHTDHDGIQSHGPRSGDGSVAPRDDERGTGSGAE